MMKWMPMHYEDGIFDGLNFDKCSNCGFERLVHDIEFKEEYNYCPKCGSKVDLQKGTTNEDI